ncbi:MAG: FIST N-terminal domain-containing protein [Aquihabitans sp.]
MGFAAAMSEHPLATHAVGETVGAILDQIGPSPDLAVVFVTGAFAGATEDVAHAVNEMLQPMAFIGATAVSVLAGRREVEEQPAVVLFAANWSGRLRTSAKVIRFEAEREGDAWRLTGTDAVGSDGTLILLADPFSFPVDSFIGELHRRSPGLTVVGGMASAASGPGGNRLVAGSETVTRGAVGIHLPAGVPVRAVVSQGCRPVGEPLVVTEATGNLIAEIAGRRALDRITETADEADPQDRALMAQGLQVGLVLDERLETFGAGDFLVRNVLGADRSTGAVAVGADVAVGTTVQFQVRDADSADADLRSSLAGRGGQAALVFTCNGRGTRLFGDAHHDATVVSDHLDGGAVAGMFCAGEIGPVDGQPFVHGFSTSVLLFDDR